MEQIVTSRLLELAKLCFLLNGRKRGSNEYDCGFFPHKVNTTAHGKAGAPKITIEFNGIAIYHYYVIVEFNNKQIALNTELNAFYNDESRANAKSIFGKDAKAHIIAVETKWALAEILQEYRNEMNETLRKVTNGKYM